MKEVHRMKVLRCESCGAPMTNEYKCEYCGSKFKLELDTLTIKPGGYLKFEGCYTMSDMQEQFYHKLYGRS